MGHHARAFPVTARNGAAHVTVRYRHLKDGVHGIGSTWKNRVAIERRKASRSIGLCARLGRRSGDQQRGAEHCDARACGAQYQRRSIAWRPGVHRQHQRRIYRDHARTCPALRASMSRLEAMLFDPAATDDSKVATGTSDQHDDGHAQHNNQRTDKAQPQHCVSVAEPHRESRSQFCGARSESRPHELRSKESQSRARTQRHKRAS